MVIKVKEIVDENVEFNKGNYKILKKKDSILLKEVLIKKKKLKYAFIGGMWYSNNDFSLKTNASIPYPFSTYYVKKILDKEKGGEIYKSLCYVKMPIIILQFENDCVCIEFDPVLNFDRREIFPFISLSEKKDYYKVSFRIFDEFFTKEKNHAWLGFGKKHKNILYLNQGKKFKFSIKIKKCKDWKEVVERFVKSKIPKKSVVNSPKKILGKATQNLYRSYDDLTGTFIQLPWKDTTGFTFVDFSYSLLSFESVRLHYFTKWFSEIRDQKFLEWSLRLRELFINPNLYKENLKHGKGLVWYNMTNLNRKGLEGLFYMDCGYGGYPGGQGTIAYNLLKYLDFRSDEEIEKLVKKSLKYILSTQKKNGSWPMAIHQEGFMRFRPENLSEHESYCGTAECIRALLQGYKRFKKDKFKEAALRGLKYLEASYPICYNGLRDIGINEAEAFSAISVIESFLDAYEITKTKKYLNQALIYSFYTLTWFYLFDTKKLRLKFNFHPISESITPRLSPYETCLIISTYMRLYKKTKKIFWKNLSKEIYKEVSKKITKNGGLCEGIFPRFFARFYSLPMEQTFATTELVNASSNFFKKTKKKAKKRNSKNITFEREGKLLIIYHENKEILKFDAEKFKIISIKNSRFNKYGFSFSFYNPYSLKNKTKMKLKKIFRGKYLKYLFCARIVNYAIKGVYAPSPLNHKFCLFEKQKTDYSITTREDSAHISCKTDLHEIECSIKAEEKNRKICISFEPLIVRVLEHDLDCKKVLFPIIGKKLKSKKENCLVFDDFILKYNSGELVKGNSFIALDQTLSTNWTHGGIYKDNFELIFNT